MNTIYIVDLEYVPTRYTAQWKEGLPEALREYVAANKHTHEVVNISGGDEVFEATPGAFLNFAGTNAYKSNQAIEISRLISQQKVKNGDVFLFTDAWNPAIIMVRYMVDLLGLDVKLHGLWHAGSYDPQDFLGRLINDKRWSKTFETSVFFSLDVNHFATLFHLDMFRTNCLNHVNLAAFGDDTWLTRTCISGQPHERLVRHLSPFAGMAKRDLILFPHRVAPEKQPEIFRDLAESMPEYEWIVCQDKKLTKDEYHELMGASKIVFSANLQETLGISSCIEAPLAGSVPMVPNRLSYCEIFNNYQQFVYDPKWTASFDSYLEHKNELMAHIRNVMENYETLSDVIENFVEYKLPEYASGAKLFSALCR